MTNEILEAPPETPVEPPQEPAAPAENDPFAVDEAQFVSLSPEQRAALDPVLSKWKDSAKATLEKERGTYKPHLEKSKALDQLVKDPRFVKWYQDLQAATRTPLQPQGAAPNQVASAEEWANALQLMANGDPTQWQALNQKMLASWAAPTIQGIQQKQRYLEQSMEMTKLFSDHADAKELDQVGRENDPTSPSLLQLCLHNVVDQNGGTMEQAYQIAKTVSQSMENRGKRAAMGLVTEKKGSVTEKTHPAGKEEGVIYVDTMEEAMTQNIEAAIDGRKVKYAVKK